MDNFQKVELSLLILILGLFLFFYLDFFPSGFVIFDEEVSAPYDFVKEENIKVEEGKLIIELEDFVLSKYESSGSMLPVLGKDSTGVGIKPKGEKNIHVGDIISFYENDDLIVHRVVEINFDDEGWFVITRGDNNNVDDKKVRFEQIDSVLVAVIY